MTTIGRTEGTARRLVMAALAAVALAWGVAGCKNKDTAAPIVGPDGQDPAAANMAQPYTGGEAGGYSAASTAASTNGGKVRVLSSQEAYQGQASGQDYSDAYGQAYGQQNAAPIIRQAPGQGGYDQGYSDAEEAGEQAIADTDQAPPPLPEYDQPPAPDPNYLWTPGYYDYASAGYYWVPGAWVAPPFYGALWTPAWWGFYGGHYHFYRGYWGPHVGFYGGIDYGFGYIGTGYYGGYWRGHDFYYNRAVTNVNVSNIHNVYNRTVVFNNQTYGARPNSRVDFNGGRGGIQARPNSSEIAALHEAHYAPVAAQRDNRLAAASNRGQFVQTDGGRPAMAFAAHPIGNTGNIGGVPREQPFNHPLAPGLTGRPGASGTSNNGQPAGNSSRSASSAGRPEGASGAEVNRVRPGSTESRNAQAGVSGGQFNSQARPAANTQRDANNGVHTPSAGAAPLRSNAAEQRPAQTTQRPAAVERSVAPVQRQSAPAIHQAAASARPQAAPMQRAAPASESQHSAPAPHAAAAPASHAGGGGGGDHGGHH